MRRFMGNVALWVAIVTISVGWSWFTTTQLLGWSWSWKPGL